jgi:hypothetical protein
MTTGVKAYSFSICWVYQNGLNCAARKTKQHAVTIINVSLALFSPVIVQIVKPTDY